MEPAPSRRTLEQCFNGTSGRIKMMALYTEYFGFSFFSPLTLLFPFALDAARASYRVHVRQSSAIGANQVSPHQPDVPRQTWAAARQSA